MNWAGRFAWRLTHLSTRLSPGMTPFGLPKIGRSNSLGSQASKIVAPSSVGHDLYISTASASTRFSSRHPSGSVGTGIRCPKRNGLASAARQTPSWGMPQSALLQVRRPSASGDISNTGPGCSHIARPNAAGSQVALAARRPCSAEGPGCGTVQSMVGVTQTCESLRVRPAGDSLPRDEPLRVGNGLDR